MIRVAFTENLRRHVDVEGCDVDAATVGDALEEVFADHPRLRSYILDDRGAVRKHVAIVVNGEAIGDRERLSDRVPDDGEIFVMQALSGG